MIRALTQNPYLWSLGGEYDRGTYYGRGICIAPRVCHNFDNMPWCKPKCLSQSGYGSLRPSAVLWCHRGWRNSYLHADPQASLAGVRELKLLELELKLGSSQNGAATFTAVIVIAIPHRRHRHRPCRYDYRHRLHHLPSPTARRCHRLRQRRHLNRRRNLRHNNASVTRGCSCRLFVLTNAVLPRHPY